MPRQERQRHLPGSIARIDRALALFMVAAWRLAFLMRMGRTSADLDAA